MSDRTTRDQLVADYLRRLEAATVDLPPEVRDDLTADVRSHVEEAAERAANEAELRQSLDRLGPPEAIAAEARTSRPETVAPAPRTSGRGFDIAAVLLVVLGGLVLYFVLGLFGTVIGWTVGVGMLWASRSWSVGEKLLGTLVWPGGLAAPLLVALTTTQTCVTEEVGDAAGSTVVSETCTGFAMPTWIGLPVSLVVLAAPLAVAAVLLHRADRRR